MDSKPLAGFSVAVLFVLFAGISLGADITDDFETLEYDEGSDVTIRCDGNLCPNTKVEACGNSKDIVYMGNSLDMEMRVPQEFNCDPGFHYYTVRDDEGNELGVEYFRVKYPHGELSGGVLALTAEHQVTGTTWKLENWQIYNGGTLGASNGEMRVKEPDVGGNNKIYREALTGYILSDRNSGPRYVDKVRDLMKNKIGNSRGIGAYEVSTIELGSNVDDGCGGNCPMGKLDDKDPAKFELRGEIVVGEEFDPENGFPTGRVPKSQKKFHLCDSDVDGIHNIEGRTVYSPRTTFDVDYLQCRDNEWIERPMCNPSETWRDGGGGWGCYVKDSKTIDVNFFDVKNIPYSDLTSEFIAGFKVPSEELNKLESHYNIMLDDIEAECWMGNNDNRPTSSEKLGEVTADAFSLRDGSYDTVPSTFEDVFVLTKIPYRENALNSTYSCVWGYRGVSDVSGSVYHAVNDFKLNSKDSEREEIAYRELQQIYNSNNDLYEPSITGWYDWSLFDNRGYPESELNPIEKEHPYCPGPPNGNDVFC